jgi:hypothetical protein
MCCLDVIQVDCGQDGVANVNVVFGAVDEHVLIGRLALTHLAGGVDTFSRNYGGWITVAPPR